MRLIQLTLVLVTFGVIVSGHARADEATRTATLYKNPQCTCCDAYADYLRPHGFEITVTPTHDLSLIKAKHGVPAALQGCHTMLIDGYVIEGHVPLGPLNKLLTERPTIEGISLPGMPLGSPGMAGLKRGPFTIYEISGEPLKVYAVE
ncbi:MAG TPA: DUF411 domain-containing protein [Steroidobacteraceae bacterium]